MEKLRFRMIRHKTRNCSGIVVPGTSATALSLRLSSRLNVNELQQLTSKCLQISLARSLMVLALKHVLECPKCELNGLLWKLLSRTNGFWNWAWRWTWSTWAMAQTFSLLSVAPCGLIPRMYPCTVVDSPRDMRSNQRAISLPFDSLFDVLFGFLRRLLALL